MNKLLVCMAFTLISLASSSQKVYFIYLQSESEQPFFIKLKDKIHNSSTSGYLILSKLHDSTYSFSVGFPQNKWPEQTFSVTINRKDHGFLLKSFGEKGWGLFDLHSLSIIQPSELPLKPINPGVSEKKDVSEFTELLSKAVDDPTLKEKPVQQIKVEEKKAETDVSQVAKNNLNKVVDNDSDAIKSSVIIEPAIIKEQPKSELSIAEVNKEESVSIPIVEYKKSIVTKRSESSTTEGFGLIYLDEYSNGEIDTIRLLIPNPQEVVVVVKEIPKEEKKFIEIDTDETIKIQENKKIVVKQITKDSLVINPQSKINCPVLAEDSDFFKLRKSMAAIESEDDMINEAKKYFKMKCFNTTQVRNLSTLFLNEQGKYSFFDVAYLYTADKENFYLLQSELKEEYYINRFKAMIRN